MKAIILAGGKGTRLSSVVNDRPKPMALVNNRPFLMYLLDNLNSCGFSDVCFAVCYLKDQIIDCFGVRYKDINLTYSIEECPQGTGGAVYKASRYFSNEAFFVINGDTYFEINYLNMIKTSEKNKSLITMGACKINDTSRYGCIQVNRSGEILSFREKEEQGAGLINMGVYYITEDACSTLLSEGYLSLESDILMNNIYRSRITVHVYKNTNFIDIGVPEDLIEAGILLKNKA